MSLRSVLIQGTKPNENTILELQKQGALPPNTSISLMVFETSFKVKKVYTCWSGGVLRDGEPVLTLVGQAAFEALMNLPLGNNETIIFFELKLGPTPLKEKVRKAIMQADEGAKICFFGDMQGELDGHMHKAFNLVSGIINVSH